MDNNKMEITLKVTVEEGNMIFKGLGKLPFEEVYELIGKLNDQANRQLAENAGNNNSSFDHLNNI
ncbi:hypothetical protein OO013_02375 [Mangrovivirga sp. M17]|uniref:Uncharacterized protein n=1 Tax=Mangrovivirga halotolerans TaxID=2993936 RepID=A0ABT3RLM2_9BACT|nr:hypothetical protein [Mangrovivirga halotolerans]MCX2742691.1 hypothetical protein [Mangrovivirga halotolerans]